MSRGLVLGSLLVGILACTGAAPPPEPVAPAPVPPPPPAPEPAASDDCLAGMVGVLAYAPGFPSEGHKARSGSVDIRVRPKEDAKTVASIEGGRIERGDGDVVCGASGGKVCATLPWAYEGAGLPVYTLRDGWAEVGMGKGGSALEPDTRCRHRGWVKLDSPMEVKTVEALLKANGLTHTLRGWDGDLCEGAEGTPHPSGFRDEVDFVLKSSRTVAGRLWLEVALIEAHCEGSKKERGTGWIPASDDQGRLQVWYYTDC